MPKGAPVWLSAGVGVAVFSRKCEEFLELSKLFPRKAVHANNLQRMADFEEPKSEATMKRLSQLSRPRVSWRSLALQKRALIIGLCVIGLTIGAGGSAFGITLDIANTGNAPLHFVGKTLTTSAYFEFIDSSGHSFQITDSDGAGDSLGLHGSISGTFNIGPVNTDGSTYYADVFGTGFLTIQDGDTPFTATVQWNEIYTYGTGGGINYNASANLSLIAYGGTRSDLQGWVADQTAVVGFTFTDPEKTLEELTTDAYNETAFHGNLSAIPVPATVLLLGTGLLGLVGLRYRRRIKA